MSQFRDLIARMAIDAQFARHARANPGAVAEQYGLTSDEAAQLRGLADAAAGTGPTTLGARLSKSGGTFGGVVTTLAADLDLTPDLDTTPDLDVNHVGPPVQEPALPVGGGGDDGDEEVVADIDKIDLSGIGLLFPDGGDASGENSGDGPTVEAMPRGGGDHEPGDERTYEALGDKGSTGGEPPAAAGDRPASSGGDGEGDGDYPTSFFQVGPWADDDGDGLVNMMDSQPDDPDTSAEPFGDNDGDGQPNLSDPTPDGMPTLKPGIDLSELTQPLVPGLHEQFELPDITPGGPLGETPDSPSGGADGDTPATLGEPPMPPETEPAAETPAAPTGEATGDEARAGGTGTPAGPATTGDGNASQERPQAPVPADGRPQEQTVAAGATSAGDAQQVLADTADADSGIGARDVAVGVVAAAAGGIAGVVAGKSLADNKPGQAPATS